MKHPSKKLRDSILAVTMLLIGTFYLNQPTWANGIIGIPNIQYTPGMANSKVTEGNIDTTICRPGYSKSIRPEVSYTEKLKIAQLNTIYNIYGSNKLSLFEEDHLIPLEVGGDPSSPKNLWPEPRYGVASASKKDQLENLMHQMVCSHKLSLKAAQANFTQNWYQNYLKYFG